MASITNESNGRKTIQFVARDGTRKSIRLGKVSRKAAAAFKLRVEHLVSVSISGHPLDDETSRWLANLSDAIVDRLAAVGLTAPRPNARLGDFLDKYMSTRHELKPGSVRKLEQTKVKLLAFFDRATPLRAITPDQAADWRVWLGQQGLSEASVKLHAGNGKTIFNEAARRGLVHRSAFRTLKSGSTASRITRYVTPEEADKVLEACPSFQWRLLFAIARYAGLRVPSESHLLVWADIDWERGRMTVRSPKTEHHAGHEQRVVPIIPRLMSILQDAFDAAAEGQERVVTLRAGGQLHRRLEAIARAAGVEPWPRAFQTLRSSCEKEWAMEFPQYAVSKWIGHSITISGKHYANDVPVELLDRAAGVGELQAVQNPVQHPAATGRKRSQEPDVGLDDETHNPAGRGALRELASCCGSGEEWSRGESNPRAEPAGKPRLHA